MLETSSPKQASAQADTEADSFAPAIEQALDRAQHYCVAHGARLTGTRRQVLGLILQSPRPIGAYDILDHLRAFHRNAAPPTVYRAIEFLSAHGLIHRIERLAAFVGCTHRLECAHGDSCGHHAQFLICGGCGGVDELEDPGIEAALAKAAKTAGFSIRHSTVEMEGLCAACQKDERLKGAQPA